MKMTRFQRSAFTVAVGSALLAACGGGGGGDIPAPADPIVSGTDVPVSATTSAAAATAFVRATAATSSETAEPLMVGDAVLAVSDSEEPEAL